MKCYYCKSGKHTFFSEENNFHLVKCSQCGLLFVINRPSDDEISSSNQQGKHGDEENQIDVTGKFQKHKVLQYFNYLKDVYPNGLVNKIVVEFPNSPK